MNHKNTFREKIANIFIESLEEDTLSWKKNWLSGSAPINIATGKRYQGINRVGLSLVGAKRNSNDNRWGTFKQIQDKGWKVKKGAKGVPVEFWQPYSFTDKKRVSWEEYYEALNKKIKGIGLISREYYVFNGQDIDGIPKLEINKKKIQSSDIVAKLSTNMKVPITNDGGSRAYYRPSTDSVHLPSPESFLSQYDYDSVSLHELGHATGAPHRLNRPQSGAFGSESYAYEELVAEITASFMAEHIDITIPQEHIDNHKAYIQSWISNIKEKPEFLFRAISDATDTANYMEYHAEIITQKEFEERTNKKINIREKRTEVAEAKQDYSIKKELAKHDYQGTQKLVQNIELYNGLTGKSNTIGDIHKAFQSTYKNQGSECSVLNDIVKALQMQEKAIIQEPSV